MKLTNHYESRKYDPNKPTVYKWKPNQLRKNDLLCEKGVPNSERCGSIHDQYNVSDKLLSWTETEEGPWWNGRFNVFEFA